MSESDSHSSSPVQHPPEITRVSLRLHGFPTEEPKLHPCEEPLGRIRQAQFPATLAEVLPQAGVNRKMGWAKIMGHGKTYEFFFFIFFSGEKMGKPWKAPLFGLIGIVLKLFFLLSYDFDFCVDSRLMTKGTMGQAARSLLWIENRNSRLPPSAPCFDKHEID